MWEFWRTKWPWGRFSPSTSVSSAKHSIACSTLIIIIHHPGWYNSLNSGRRTKRTQPHPTQETKEQKLRTVYVTAILTVAMNLILWHGGLPCSPDATLPVWAATGCRLRNLKCFSHTKSSLIGWNALQYVCRTTWRPLWFLTTYREVLVRFLALPDFLRSSGSGTGST
jgi:hypothetical protein